MFKLILSLKWWIAALVLISVQGLYIANIFFVSEDKRALLPGKTTDGHYQIEMECTACHKADMSDLGQPGVINEACMKCHKEDLDKANDSHPVKKFKDPRNADRLERVDALQCISCHREHVPDQTHLMAVSLPEDYCAHCHEMIAEERPSHLGMGFDTCATAGCHNFHDNLALYESFLVRHAKEPDMLNEQLVLKTTFKQDYTEKHGEKVKQLTWDDHNAPAKHAKDQTIMNDWLETAHAAAGVNCMDCHQDSNKKSLTYGKWLDNPDHTSCQSCHSHEVKGFLKGKHGMRLAAGLSPMTPGMARQPMKSEVAHAELSCVSCHSTHRFDKVFAATDACMSCHDDEHSRNYVNSRHHDLWRDEVAGRIDQGMGVSCASCHMPRVKIEEFGEEIVRVSHNQSENLRPNEKMIRTTCMQCHGLGFAIDNMADRKVIEGNFSERTEIHIESIDMAYKRELEKKEHEKNRSNQ